MAYLYWKAVHIIALVSWFAGLFYIVRLFVYHAEARERQEPERGILEAQYSVMEDRLWKIITVPAMWLTVVSAAMLLVLQPGWLKQGWMWAKLGLVVVLLAYHGYCAYILRRLSTGASTWSGQQFRWLNEVPTLLLIVITLLAVLKTQFQPGTTTVVMIAITVLFAVSIQLYARRRKARDASAPAAQGDA